MGPRVSASAAEVPAAAAGSRGFAWREAWPFELGGHGEAWPQISSEGI